MPDEPDKPGGDDGSPEADEPDENERPTVSPPFDPAAFAREMASRPSPQPMQAPRLPRIRKTPVGLAVPPHGGRPPPVRRKTPQSTLSLVNARIPSNLPPPLKEEPRRPASAASFSALDREWAELERGTRPPPEPEEGVLDIEADEPDVEEHGAMTVRRPAAQDLLQGGAAVTEREMNDRVSLGDYSGALAIAEELLATDPGHAVARECAEQCRAVLKQMYATRIGPLDRVPVVMVPRDQLRWLSIDHRAGFVLSLVDGVSTLEMIIDLSGMPELDTLRILSELAQQRIISLR